MSWKSGGRNYGRVAVIIHWATALAVFGLLGSGLYMEDLTDPAVKATILRGHAVMGTLVLLLTLVRLAWWLLVDRRPAHAAGMPRWQALAASATHGLLYVIILAMTISGLAMIVLSGAGSILFAGAQGPLPDFEELAPRGPHGIAAWALMALIGLHVAAALYHQFVLRDRLLGRMGVGRTA